MYCQQQIAQRLPDVVQPPQMSMLMRQHIVHLPFLHAAGQINAGSNDTQQERRCDRIAQPNILPQVHGLPHPEPQAQGADQPIQQQSRPYRGPDRQQGRQKTGRVAAHAAHFQRADGYHRVALLGMTCSRQADAVHIQHDGGLIAAAMDILEVLHTAILLHGGRGRHLIGRQL